MPPVKPARSSSSAPAKIWKCWRATIWAKASELPPPLPPINSMFERSIIFGPLAIDGLQGPRKSYGIASETRTFEAKTRHWTRGRRFGELTYDEMMNCQPQFRQG